MGQHDARLRTHDIAAGYAAATVTGAAEVGLRATQLFGMQSMIFKQAQTAMLASSQAAGIGTDAGAAAFRRAGTYGRLAAASFPFDPFSQAAAVGKRMPGWQAAGRSAEAAATRAAAMQQAGMSVARSTRFIGAAARMGMRLPGLLTGGATFGLSMAAQEAVIGAAGSIYEGHADRMKSATLVNQTAGASGVAFSQSEARGSDLTGMASRMGMDFEEFSGLTQTLSAGGNFQGVSDLQEFKSKLRGSLQQLKEIAQVTNSTLQEAAQVSAALKQQGFSGGQLPAAASQAFGLGSATGLGAGQFLQAGAMGAQYGAATNMGMSRGSSMFQQALGGVEFAMQQGKFSPEMIQRLGGSSSSATMALMQGTLGQAGQMGSTVSQMMGFIAKKGEGEYSTPVIDQAKLEKLLNGGVSRQQLAAVSQSQQVLGMSTAIQRAAMPQVNQMLHATLSDGTSSPEEYLRKAEMMGIPPDTAKLIMETERNRGFTNASAQLASGSALAQHSAAASENSGGLIGRLFGGKDTFGIHSSIRDFGSSISRNTHQVTESLFPSERASHTPTAAGRQLLIDTVRKTGGLDAISGFNSLAQRDVADDGFGGSGNPFSKGRGEAVREARFREFETLFTRNERGAAGSRAAVGFLFGRNGRTDEGSVGEDRIFGETSFSRFAISRDAVDEAVRHRATFRPSEEGIRRASHAFRGDHMTTSKLLESIGVGKLGTLTAGRRGREELVALAGAKMLGIGNPGQIRDLIGKVKRGERLSDQDAMLLQKTKGEFHATANAAGFSAQDLIGSDITSLGNFGGMTGEALSDRVDELAGEVAGSQSDLSASRGGALRSLLQPISSHLAVGAGLLGGAGVLGGDAESDALKSMLTGPGKASHIRNLGKVRDTIESLKGTNVSNRDRIQRAIDMHMPGLEGDELNAVTKLMGDQQRLRLLSDLERGASAEEYHRLVDPIAGAVSNLAIAQFGGRVRLKGGRGSLEGDFEDAAVEHLGFGFGKGRSARQRSDAMAALMDVGLRGDGSLTNEANKLREAGLRDVAALFSTVEALAGGGVVKGFEDLSEDQRRKLKNNRKGAIDLLKEKGMLSGIAGAQAQASADSSLQGRSLAGDLLAFSNMTKDLVTVVQHIVDETGVSIPKTQSDTSGQFNESDVSEDGAAP